MTDGTSLDSIFNDEPTEPVETAEVEAAPEPSQEAESPSDGRARGPDGKFVAKQQSDVETTGPSPDKLPAAEYKAIREEREKRQTLERELEALKTQFQSLQQPKEPEAPPPSLWEDEQGWQQHFGGQIAQQASFNARLDMSEMLASQAHEDFDDVKSKFLEMAQGNPALAQQALAAKHPWEKAYQIAKNATQMAELGATNLDELKAKLREELMAEIGQQPQTPSLPHTLTTQRNVGGRSGPAWTGPRPLADLLS
jgi:hypothetical protein